MSQMAHVPHGVACLVRVMKLTVVENMVADDEFQGKL